MRKILFTGCVLFATTTACFSQFAQPSSRWNYESQQQSFTPNGYCTIFYDGEEIKGAKTTQKLSMQGQHRFQSGPTTYYTTALESLGTLNVYKSGDSVFTYRDGAFELAFKTDGQVGDIWNLGTFSNTIANDKRAFLLIDSVYTKSYNGVFLKELRTVACDSSGQIVDVFQPTQNQDDIRTYVYYSGIINEKFGPLTNFKLLNYAGDNRIYNEVYASSILCFEEIDFGQHVFQPGVECQMGLNVGLNEEQILNFQMYPNPANSLLFIETENATNTEIKILDATGRIVVLVESTQMRTTLPLSQLQNGSYFVQVTSGNLQTIKKFMKQE